MISKQITSSQFDLARRNPVLSFAEELKTVKGYHQEVLRLDNSAEDIDPREGYVRHKNDDTLVAAPSFYRHGNFVCQFEGENARASFNLDSQQKGDVIREYDYNHADQSLSVRAYSVDERQSGPLQETGAVEVHYDLNREPMVEFSEANQKIVYGLISRAIQKDNDGEDEDPRPGRYEKSTVHLPAYVGSVYNVAVRVQGNQASGCFTNNQRRIEFEAGLGTDGNPDFENQNFKFSFPSGGLGKEYAYQADSKCLDVTSKLIDETEFYSLNLT
ncbi:MAG: hypothetical protein U0931_24980 [Vulcanimicrobiota bacterium]